MWAFCSSTGRLSHDGLTAAQGYSGHGQGKLFPADEAIPNVGPLPHGLYIIGLPRDSPHLGPVAMPLFPDPSTEMYGRSGCWIHGDSTQHPGQASTGCICLPRAARQAIADSHDNQLTVYRAEPAPTTT